MNMFLIRKIKKELKKLNISYRSINIIQNKDGIIVARILCESESYIIKYFEKNEYKREIDNYKILASLDIETISVTGFTDSAILMEDISNSTVFRLGTKADLDNPTIAKAIAKWYKNLHTKGELYTKEDGNNLYDQTDYFTLKNIETIKRKTNTENLEVWTLIVKNYDFICVLTKSSPLVII